MRKNLRGQLVSELCDDADLLVCEGVMGLYDGATATEGSTADLAVESGWPVILVVDARAQAASAAAVVKGFTAFRDDVVVGGVIFNRVGSDRHCAVIRAAMTQYLPEVPLLGFLPRNDALSLPSRHLGLVQAGEHTELETFLNDAAVFISDHVDIEALLSIARPVSVERVAEQSLFLAPLGQRVAVASDQAFAFSYPHLLDGWRQTGATIIPFSPLNDEAPSSEADAVYLPGGYPELHAGKLAAGKIFMPELRAAASRGVPVYGECGGYMVLGESLIDKDGTRHIMAGLLPLETSFAERRLHLGYRQAMVCDPHAINGGLVDVAYRGHEFHYATTVRQDEADPLFRICDAQGDDLGTTGLVRGNVAGSFIHLVDRYE